MRKYSNGNKTKWTPIIGIAIGIGVALFCSLLLTCLQTSLILKGTLSTDNVNLFAFIIRTISVFAGCLLGLLLSTGKPLPAAGIIVCAYMVFLLSIGILLFDGTTQNLMGGIGSALLGGILAVFMKLKPQKRRKKIFKIGR